MINLNKCLLQIFDLYKLFKIVLWCFKLFYLIKINFFFFFYKISKRKEINGILFRIVVHLKETEVQIPKL